MIKLLPEFTLLASVTSADGSTVIGPMSLLLNLNLPRLELFPSRWRHCITMTQSKLTSIV